MTAVDITTVRQQKFGYAEHHGVTGGVGQPSVVVTSLADSGAGSLRTALSSGNRYITFHPSIHGGTITLTSTMTCSGSNITLDGVGADMTVTGATSRFEGDNIVIAGMSFKDAGGISNDCITLRRPTTPTTNQRVLISWCTLHNPTDPANTDTTLDIIWRRGWDTIVTVVGTFHGRSKRGSLVHAGDAPAPGYNEERGWYYVTWAFAHWFRCFERHPFTREGHIHLYNNYVQRYGGAASSGSGARMGDDDPSPPLTNWMLAENCVVLPLDVGETDYLGVVATNPQEKWFGPSSSNNGTPNMRADGTYLKTNGSTTPTEEEIDPGAVGTPPYAYSTSPANDALESFINSIAGHPAAIRTTLPGVQEVNPAVGAALLWTNRAMTVTVDETGGAVTDVDLVVGGSTIPMAKTGPTTWSATLPSLTAGTSTTIKAVASVSGGGTVESPTYPAMVMTSGPLEMIGSIPTVRVTALSQSFTTSLGALAGTTAAVRVTANTSAFTPFAPPAPPPPPVVPRIGVWRFGVGPWTATVPSAEVTRWVSASISHSLDRGISASMSMAARDPASALISEMATDLWVYLDGDLYARFRVTKVDQEWDEHGADAIGLTMLDYYAVLFRQKTATALTYTGVGQGQIAWSLIAHVQAQTGGNLGLTQGTLNNAITRDRAYEQGANVGELLDQLVKVIDGPRLVFHPTKVVDVLSGATWPVHAQPLMHGANARRLRRESGADRFANVMFGTGDAELTTMVIAESPGLATDPRGRWVASAAWPSVILQSTLDEATEGALQEAVTPVSVWRATIEPSRWFADSRYQPGDQLSIVQPATVVAPLQAAQIIPAQMTDLQINIGHEGATDISGAFVAVEPI